MKDSKSKLWFMVTIILGIVTSLIVTNYLKGLEQTVAKDETLAIVVAAVRINSGTLITSDMLKTVNIPTRNVPNGGIRDTSQAINKFAKVDLWPDDYIFTDKLTTENTSTELMYKIPKGKRAITIEITPITGVGGHIKPGHFIDILLKYKISEKPEGNKVSTMLQKIQVLAVGADLTKKEGIQAGDNLTLAVSPQEAQLITLAEGSIKLILRPTNDADIKKVKSSNLKSLYERVP